MTTRTPLPPLPDLATLAHTTRPVLAATAARLLEPRAGVAMYEDSPYIAAAHGHDPEPDEGDDGPWCAAPRP